MSQVVWLITRQQQLLAIMGAPQAELLIGTFNNYFNTILRKKNNKYYRHGPHVEMRMAMYFLRTLSKRQRLYATCFVRM